MAKVLCRFFSLNNLDLSGSSFAVAGYVTMYISKVDKNDDNGVKDMMHEVESQMRTAVELYEGNVKHV